MQKADPRPFYVLAALVVLLGAALLVPASRGWLAERVAEPIRSQAEHDPTLRAGYSFESLAFWAIVGAALAWALYELLFVRLRVEPDRAFFLSLAPALLLGPLLHAALVGGALPSGSVLAYLASEPVVYLTIAAFAAVGLALGRLTRRPVAVPLAWGALGVAAALWLLVPQASAEGLRLAAVLLALAAVPAGILGYAYWRWRPQEDLGAVLAIVGAHALDGATTWMVLRDPFGLGFHGFGERNPVSLGLVNLSNGWPYFALKLALPLVLLSLVKTEKGEERLRAFLLFAVFVLGFGPGMANLLQVIFG